MVLALLFWVVFLELAVESLGAKRTKRKATNGRADHTCSRPLSELHGKPDFKPAIAIKWAARRRRAQRQRERESSKGPRPQTPRMMNEDFVSKIESINLWNLVILSSHRESF
jgi:hypothetical protein